MASYRTIIIVHLILFVLLSLGVNGQSEWDVRLINDSIFEVYLSDQWGTICDDFWSLANTDVACRSVGYRRGNTFSHGEIGDTDQFGLDDVICLGNESHIRDCRHRRLTDDCSSDEHIRIFCEKDGCESYAPFADTESILVKLYSDGLWYYLSSDGFTMENANVVCRENTKTMAETFTIETRENSSSFGIYPYHIDCSGYEDSLCECRKTRQSSISDSIVKIKCESNEGNLTLVNGVNRNSGFVLINHNETWKGICFSDEDLNFQTAYVACKQLGYKGVYNFYYDRTLQNSLNGGNYFIRITKNFYTWISRPNCTGDESYITDCTFDGWEDHICAAKPLWIYCEPYGDHDVILVNSNFQYSGISKIFYNHNWHSVCIPDTFLDDRILNSMCRSIGFVSYNNWRIIDEPASSYLHLNYTCFGYEKSLASCYSEEIGPDFCRSTVQLYLSCNQPLDETPSLAYGSSETGIVDLYVANKWGISCIIYTNDLEQTYGQVICSQLGLNMKGVYFEYLGNVFWEQKYWQSIFNCSGNETRLSEGNCLETEEYVDQCAQSSDTPVKLSCRPSSNEMRLIQSSTNSSFFRIQFLTPERQWAPVCYDTIQSINFCNTFGYNSIDVKEIVTDNVHTYTKLDCPPNSTRVEQCTVRLFYDYISIYGCTTILEIYCSNLEAPTLTVTDLGGVSYSNSSILLKWTHTYSISEEDMKLEYNMEMISETGLVTSSIFGKKDIDWRYDTSRVNTRYYIVRDLESHTTYLFKLRLKNAAGYGRFGNSIIVTPIGKEPIRPQITAPSENQLFTITSVSEYESFSLVQQCVATGVPQPTIFWTSNNGIIENPTDHTITIRPGDLRANGYINEYIFTCTASNIAGGNIRRITIEIDIKLIAVSTPIVKSLGFTNIDIMWSEYGLSDYVIHYDICVGISNERGCVLGFQTTNTEYLIENLEKDTLYNITIVAVTEFGRSPASETLSVETTIPVEPEIKVPERDTFFLIESIAQLDAFSLTQACTSTGVPQPTVSWKSNTELIISGNTLEIPSGYLSINDSINPYIFTCKAINLVGEDSKEVRIKIDIDVIQRINETVNLTNTVVSMIARIISLNNMGVNVSSENITEAQESIDNSAEDLDKLITRYIDDNRIDASQTETIENLFVPASDIIRKDAELNSRRNETNVIKPEERRVATASKALQNTLNSLENLASNFVSTIDTIDGKTKSVVVSSADITIVAENIVLSEYNNNDLNPSDITIPNNVDVENGPIKERILIPNEVAMILSNNSNKLRIATTIVRNDRMETDKESNTSSLFSNIVSLVVPGSKGRIINLPKPIKLSIPVPQSNPQKQNQNCSFLNQSSWSTQGLTTTSTEKNLTFCYTYHFTSFAVFVTPRKLGGSDDLKLVASIVSYVLVSISFISLIISLILFLLTAKTFFKVEANIVYFNYALAMTLAFGLFLFGIQAGSINHTVCMVIAFLLHYIWLTVFVWTLCNGILIMYKLTIGILRQRKIYPILIVFGWISPIIIPIITLAIKHDNYVDSNEHCFVTFEDGLIWAFIGPIVAILLINIIILFIATIRIATTKFGTERLDKKEALRKGLISALILTPLLGIPWLLLLLNIFIVNPIVQWSFIITNGLMGVFFFVAVTLRNEEVQKLCMKMTKDSSQASTSVTDGKSSNLFSKKYKRALSKDSYDPLSPDAPISPNRKGAYFALGPVSSIQEPDVPTTLQSPSEKGSFKYDDAPPIPKPRKLQKGSSSVDSLNEGIEVPSHYDVPCDIPRKDSPEPNPIYEVIPEDVPTNYENVSDTKFKQIVSGEEKYQNL